MNDRTSQIKDDLLSYQVEKLRALIDETVQCCQGRMDYLSERFGLPQAELRCIMLFREERYLTLKSIARRLDVAKSRVTKIIEGLLRKELVLSTDDPRDARIKLIGLTPAGKAKCDELSRFTMDLYGKILHELSSDERKAVLSSLAILRTAMEAVKKQMV